MTPRSAHARAILLPARSGRLALGREARARGPSPPAGASELGIEREHGQQLDALARARPARHRRAEREHAVVGVRRDDDDRGFAERSHDGL